MICINFHSHLLVLSEDEHYDMRIRYLIKDILDLRKKNWEDEKKKKAAAVAEAKYVSSYQILFVLSIFILQSQ